MSCTRAKESRTAIVLGAAGAECRLPFGAHLLSVGFDPAASRIVEGDDGDLTIEPVTLLPSAPAPVTVALLSDDATPGEVYE